MKEEVCGILYYEQRVLEPSDHSVYLGEEHLQLLLIFSKKKSESFSPQT